MKPGMGVLYSPATRQLADKAPDTATHLTTDAVVNLVKELGQGRGMPITTIHLVRMPDDNKKTKLGFAFTSIKGDSVAVYLYDAEVLASMIKCLAVPVHTVSVRKNGILVVFSTKKHPCFATTKRELKKADNAEYLVTLKATICNKKYRVDVGARVIVGALANFVV